MKPEYSLKTVTRTATKRPTKKQPVKLTEVQRLRKQVKELTEKLFDITRLNNSNSISACNAGNQNKQMQQDLNTLHNDINRMERNFRDTEGRMYGLDGMVKVYERFAGHNQQRNQPMISGSTKNR